MTPVGWLVLSGAFAAACGGGSVLTVDRAYGYAPTSRENAAVYLMIHNPGQEADTLVGASSPVATGAVVHRSVPEAGGQMVGMEPVDRLPIPAGSTVTFVPGRLHLMLTTLHELPRVSDTIAVILSFAHAGTRTVRVPLLAYGDDPPD